MTPWIGDPEARTRANFGNHGARRAYSCLWKSP